MDNYSYSDDESTNEKWLQMAPGGGNTRTPPVRLSPSKKWCFTYNNYKKEELAPMETNLRGLGLFIMGFETAPTTGTPHIQGYIEFFKKCRPSECIKIKKIHWEKAKGSRNDNIIYCSKENNYVTNFDIKKPVKDPLEGLELYDYQKLILNILKNMEPNNRDVYWFYNENGNIGKSCFSKHCFLKYGTICVNGKAADVKYVVAEALKNKDVNSVIFDIPRTNEGFVSYQAIEEIKNGMVISTKYESCCVAFNVPHLFIFSNYLPDKSCLSSDRWNIYEIDDFGMPHKK